MLLSSALSLYAALFYAKYIAYSDAAAATHLGLLGTFLSIVMTASPLVTVVSITVFISYLKQQQAAMITTAINC